MGEKPHDWPALWDELHLAIGRAVAGWSQLEHALADAFATTLGLPVERAQRVFFSARSFNGKHDMLKAALQSNPLPDNSTEGKRQLVFKAACKTARRWAATRNKLAHDRPAVVAKGSRVLGGTVGPNVLYPDIKTNLDQILTIEAMSEATASFKELARLISKAGAETDLASLDTLLQQVRGLPQDPYSHSLIQQIAATDALPPRPSRA